VDFDLGSALRQGLLASPPARSARAVPAGQLVWRRPLLAGARIFCIQRNYQAHAAELGNEAPARPAIFLRNPTSLQGPDEPLHRPVNSECHDYEGELGVVIGRAGRGIRHQDALDHVAGYTCFNDGSIRDWQQESITAGKNFDASGALGPVLVPARRVPRPQSLGVRPRVNGTELQNGSTAQMIHDVAALIAYLSGMTCLQPGDVIATGTPEGVGWARNPPLWLRPGDVVEVEIEGVGVLANPVIAAP
jgi:2-keto-4-pentenoate hydratase/2-oxohepta-3-ene-1,7-dioic acid hydratase in catechol pathway